MEQKFQLAQRRPTLSPARLRTAELRYQSHPILAAMETDVEVTHRK